MTGNVTVVPSSMTGNQPIVPHPLQWRLQAVAFGPISTRLPGRRRNHDICFEPIRPDPNGQLIHVVDHKGTRHSAAGPAAGQAIACVQGYLRRDVSLADVPALRWFRGLGRAE